MPTFGVSASAEGPKVDFRVLWAQGPLEVCLFFFVRRGEGGEEGELGSLGVWGGSWEAKSEKGFRAYSS